MRKLLTLRSDGCENTELETFEWNVKYGKIDYSSYNIFFFGLIISLFVLVLTIDKILPSIHTYSILCILLMDYGWKKYFVQLHFW